MEESLDPRLRADPSTASSHYPAPLQTSINHHPSTITNRLQLQQPPLPYSSHTDSHESPYTTHHSNYDAAHDGSNGAHGSPESGNNHEVGADGQKRPRACEACRGLKVRCEFDGINPEGACKRCAKAHRNCIVTQPSRKRQKKTDSRVAELEKKIDALTASLHASQTKTGAISEEAAHESHRTNQYEQVNSNIYSPHAMFEPQHDTRLTSGDWEGPTPQPSEVAARKSALPPMVMAGQKRKHQETKPSLSTGNPSTAKNRVGRAGSSSCPQELPRQRGSALDEYTDVIDRGLITPEVANRIFTRYTDEMTPLMPAVVFPPETTMADVRKTKPVLFLAILSAASGSDHPEFQRTITKEVMQVYATRILCNGEKTLELIQALLISTIWYWPPEHFEELKFYQLIHLAAVMAIDLNINRKSKTPKTRKIIAGLWRDHPWRRIPFPDPESIEARRAWLACYFLCCNTAMGLRRQNLIRWSNYLDECVQVLETSPEAALSDKTLCVWVRSQHIAEEVGYSFSMDDPFAAVTISDSKVQYALKGFERDLEKWSEQVPKESQSPILKITENVLSLYMHEVAMHVDHNVEEFKPPFTEESLRGGQIGQDSTAPLTAIHINALSTCLTAIDGIFMTFLSIDIETIRLLPVMHFVRVAYAVVVLIKMYFAAAVEGSELGRVMDKDNMKVELYLDRLLEQFRAAAANDKSRPATKFLMVLVMLKTWFHRQKGGKRDGENEDKSTLPDTPATIQGETAQANMQIPQQQQQRDYSPANTPLQLLSEVATGSQSRPQSRNQFIHQPWQDHQGYTYNSQMPQGFDVNNIPYGIGNIDPNLSMMSGMEYDIKAGDGFEQAMGMTLGEGDFNYFSDDAFFGAVMDSVGGAPNMF